MLCRMSKIPHTKKERRNPVEKSLEYDIIGYFKGGEHDKGEWDRRWVAVARVTRVDGWEDKVEEWRWLESEMASEAREAALLAEESGEESDRA